MRLSEAIRGVASGALQDLSQLCTDAGQKGSEDEKKLHLLQGIEIMRHRLLRLLVAVKWTEGNAEVVSRAQVGKAAALCLNRVKA